MVFCPTDHRPACSADGPSGRRARRSQACGLLMSLVLGVLWSGGTGAQTIYKSVGPDGKVVFSDKPPAADQGQTTVTGHPPPAARPPAPAATPTKTVNSPAPFEPPGAPLSPAPAHPVAKKAEPAARPVAEPSPPPPVANPELEKAVTGVMGLEDLVHQTEDLCLRTLPTSFKKYNAATDGWKKRNAPILAQQRRVLADMMPPPQRQLIEAAIKAKTQQLLAPVNSASAAARIKWCDQSMDEVSKGAMDPSSKPHLLAPLMAYNVQARRP